MIGKPETEHDAYLRMGEEARARRRETDLKNNILHSLGTLCALGMVIDSRCSAFHPNPTPGEIMGVVKSSIKEMEIGFHKRISS